jgi:hypothetical protein
MKLHLTKKIFGYLPPDLETPGRHGDRIFLHLRIFDHQRTLTLGIYAAEPEELTSVYV